MDFFKRKEKPLEKVQIAKASLPSHATDINATYFKCDKQDIKVKNVREARLPCLRVEDSVLSAIPRGTIKPNTGSFIPN
jgi:hypothetical protein